MTFIDSTFFKQACGGGGGGQYLLLSHTSSDAPGGPGVAVKKRLARQRMVNGSVDLAGAGGLISDSHAQRKAMFLKQRNVSHTQRTQDEQGTYFLVSSNRLLTGHMGPPEMSF